MKKPELPLVVRWDTYPLDIPDPFPRFRVSNWNYFLENEEAEVIVGYWEAEDGVEVIDVNEVMHVVEGELYVRCEGEEEVAKAGDTVVAVAGRSMEVRAVGPVRVLFFCFGVDVVAQKRRMHEALKAAGKESPFDLDEEREEI